MPTQAQSWGQMAVSGVVTPRVRRVQTGAAMVAAPQRRLYAPAAISQRRIQDCGAGGRSDTGVRLVTLGVRGGGVVGFCEGTWTRAFGRSCPDGEREAWGVYAGATSTGAPTPEV